MPKNKTISSSIKKIIAGTLVAGAAFAPMSAKAESKKSETKDSVKITQVMEEKSEMRQKVGYLDEYLAAVERGENKDEAYRRLMLQIADNNQQDVQKLQKDVQNLQKTITASNTVKYVLLESLLLFAIFAPTSKTIAKQVIKALEQKGKNY